MEIDSLNLDFSESPEKSDDMVSIDLSSLSNYKMDTIILPKDHFKMKKKKKSICNIL